jgi:hypothetical protein
VPKVRQTCSSGQPHIACPDHRDVNHESILRVPDHRLL